ncbi:MAG: glycosyltransferase family 2 protein [Rhodospirillales bacterium]
MTEKATHATTDMLQHRYAVVIPAYNESATIRDVALGAAKAAHHVIVVDDGSSDQTAACLDGLPVVCLRLAANRGKAAALAHGFEAALKLGVEGVVTLDGDGQHRSEDIIRIAEAGLKPGERIVIGARLSQPENFPKARLRANRFANFWISWAAGYRIEDSQSGFRYYPASLLRRLDMTKIVDQGFMFESEVLILAARAGVLSEAVTIPALYAGVIQRPSHFRPVRDISRIVVMVAWKLISRGMYPLGLYYALRKRKPHNA